MPSMGNNLIQMHISGRPLQNFPLLLWASTKINDPVPNALFFYSSSVASPYVPSQRILDNQMGVWK